MAGQYVPSAISDQELVRKVSDVEALDITGMLDELSDTVETYTAINFDLFYKIAPSYWYQTFPFAFEIENEGRLLCRFFLPIPPQNYTIQDMSTSEAHATIGGVVEEVNAPVFSMITLVGTTGLSINMPNIGRGYADEVQLNVKSRKFIDDLVGTKNNPLARMVQQLTDGALSLVEVEKQLPYQRSGSAVNTPKTAGSDGTHNTVSQLFTEVAEPAATSWTDRINPFSENMPEVPVSEFTNGWGWSQALRQFFMIYQREREKNPNLGLHFSDYKSRASYRCVPRSVQFTQNANAPFLLNYTIILKCWDLGDAETDDFNFKAVDRFNGDLSEVYTTSISGAFNKLSGLANSMNRSPSIAGSFLRNSTGLL